MLYARINQEYVNEDEIAKRIAFERTLSFVNRLYPDDQKEVSLKPQKLSGQLQYGYDTLFQAFRTAIESVLTADFNDSHTFEKSNEILRKYNQLSSYLKNIINLNQMSPEDEEKIKGDFNGLRSKLVQLEKIAEDNGFLEVDDIKAMVAEIYHTSTVKRAEFKVVRGTEGMIKSIQSKEEAQKTMNEAYKIIPTLNLTLLGTHKDFTTIKDVIDFFENFNDAITPSVYDAIKNNYNSLVEISVINADMVKDLNKSMLQSRKIIDKTTESIAFATVSDQPPVIYNYLITNVLPTLLPNVDVTQEQKQIEQLIDTYLTAMDNVDPGKTDNDRTLLMTHAQQSIVPLEQLLLQPDNYLTSYVAGDINTYHTDLINASNKLMTDLIDQIVVILDPASIAIAKKAKANKAKKAKQASKAVANQKQIQSQKPIYETQNEFGDAMKKAILANRALRKTSNNPMATLYKNPYINSYKWVDSRSNYGVNWGLYSALDKDKNNPAQKKIKENYFDKI